ncbi:MAG: hypothetical protein ACI4LA_01625 [Emergencia sp.]
MKIGVRFCGGCNPRYDRGAYYRKTVRNFPQHSFSVAEEGPLYDVLLVIGGCTSCCASYEQFRYERLIRIWDDTEIPEF